VGLLGESQGHQFNHYTEPEVLWVDHMVEVMVVLIVAEVISVEEAIMVAEDIIVTM